MLLSSTTDQSQPSAAVILCAMVLFMAIGKAQTCRHATLIRTDINLDERAQILETHNRLRSQVAQGAVPNQPGAQNMQEMVWDDELAYKAQQWAQECTFDHDPGRYLNRFTMGQNLAIIWSTIPLADDDGDFPSRIQNWFNEVQKYAWGAQWSEATGHYSQLVWGDSNLIGCGFSYYKDARRFNKLWVCNYGPGGNVVGSNPYEVGHPACSNYGMQPSYRYSGLCSNQGNTGPSGGGGGGGTGSGGGLQSNYLGYGGFTYKTETYNAPTYQSPPSAPATTTVQTSAPAALQNVFKPIVQAVVQPVNSFINTDYSFKSIFDRFKEVLNLQHVSVASPPQHQQQQFDAPATSYGGAFTNTFNQQPNEQSSNNNNNYQQQPQQQQSSAPQQQYSNYHQQAPDPYHQQNSDYHQQQQQQQQSAHHSGYQQQTYATAPDHQSYQTYQQPQQQDSTSYYNRNNNPFLTYDWSQLFNQNSDPNNG